MIYARQINGEEFLIGQVGYGYSIVFDMENYYVLLFK